MTYTKAQILIVSLSFKVYSSFAFWTTFAIIHIFGCLYLSSQIYYMGRVKFGEFWMVIVEVYLVILGFVLARICLIYDYGGHITLRYCRIELENSFVNFFSSSDAGMFARVFVLLRYDCCSCPVYKVKL